MNKLTNLFGFWENLFSIIWFYGLSLLGFLDGNYLGFLTFIFLPSIVFLAFILVGVNLVKIYVFLRSFFSTLL
jgi:fumarate reductase subunit C